MTGWSLVFLGAIALATIVMALVQVGVIIYVGRLGRRLNRLADQVEHEISPLITRLNAMSGDAARATSLAVAQVERADHLFAQFAQRVDHVLALVESAVVAPAREGLALLSGLRAVLAALRTVGERREPQPTRGTEDEEALFIG